jgi:hypothetical protein
MQVWTCYMINMPSGRLVIIQSSNQSVTSALGWWKSTVNRNEATIFSLAMPHIFDAQCSFNLSTWYMSVAESK